MNMATKNSFSPTTPAAAPIKVDIFIRNILYSPLSIYKLKKFVSWLPTWMALAAA